MERSKAAQYFLSFFVLAVLLSSCAHPPVAKQPVRPRPSVESPDASFIRGRRLLEEGRFEEAARTFEKLVGTPDFAGIANAYLYLGIANLARINPSHVTEAKTLRLKGFASFQNALRFDRAVTLPKGYEKFREVFEEARKGLGGR